VRNDIYNREQTLKNALEKMRSSEELSISTRILIMKFYHECLAQGLSTARLVKYLYSLHQFSLMLGKPFDKTAREDVIELVEKIEGKQDWSDWTKQH